MCIFILVSMLSYYFIGKETPQMKDIEDHVVTRFAKQWRQLGNLLNIDQNSMDNLEHNYPNDCEKCCSRMFEAWLQENTKENTTWEFLINAINKLPTGMKLSSLTFAEPT